MNRVKDKARAAMGGGECERAEECGSGKESGNRGNREGCVMKYLPLAYAAARRFSGRGAEYEELCQAGALGLICACDRYDEAKHIPFPAYAFKFIEGEIRSLLRSGCSLHISRSARAAASEIAVFADEYEKQNGKSPCVSLISEALGIEITELCFIMNAFTGRVSPDSDEGRPAFDSVESGDDTEETAVSRVMLKNALRMLPEQEAAIIALRYFGDMTQRETAERLNCSQSKVSKCEASALIKIRAEMEKG